MSDRVHRTNEPLTEDVLAGLIAHADFLDAGRTLAAGTVQLFLDYPAMRYFDKDRGTTLVSLFAACLYFSEDGLTMARLKAICRKSRACSVGRAIRMMGDLRARGDIVPISPGLKVRPQQLMLSDRLLAYHKDWLRLHAVALDTLSPPGTAKTSETRAMETFPAHMRALGTVLEESADLVTDDTLALNVFADRDAGMLILLDIIAQNKDVLTSAPVKIAMLPLSNRFGVSRVHILTLLRDADTAKLVTWSADSRELTLSLSLIASLKRYFAAMLMVFAYCSTLADAHVKSVVLQSEPATAQ